MRTRLIVFAKLAVEGRVKTRLAASVGPARALEVHRRLVDTTLALARASGADTLELRYDAAGAAAGSAATALPAALSAEGWRTGPQRGVDLGARMHEALDASLADGERPVLVGSDCPSLCPGDLRDAFDALAAADAVFAPAEDGGYALVGVSRSAPGLFDRMRWGTSEVMTTTLARAEHAGLRVALLRTVWDVDVEADLRRWEALQGGRGDGAGRGG
jgi:rSAM/selenodomain-associated transferase 1